jgi:Domain of unknown function (DUF4277)
MLKTLGSENLVSVGTATVAMILNGLGWSLRQPYLLPQVFANKPIEHVLGSGMTAEMLNDDCLGRTLDWLSAHDLTKLFAGIATRAADLWHHSRPSACGYDLLRVRVAQRKDGCCTSSI